MTKPTLINPETEALKAENKAFIAQFGYGSQKGEQTRDCFLQALSPEEVQTLRKWVTHKSFKHFFDYESFAQSKAEASKDIRAFRPFDVAFFMQKLVDETSNDLSVNSERFSRFNDPHLGTVLKIDISDILHAQLEQRFPDAVRYARAIQEEGTMSMQNHLFMPKDVGDSIERFCKMQKPPLDANRVKAEVRYYDQFTQNFMMHITRGINSLMSEHCSEAAPSWDLSEPKHFGYEEGYSTSNSILSRPDQNGCYNTIGHHILECNDRGEIVIYTASREGKPMVRSGRVDPDIKAHPDTPADNHLRYFAERGVQFQGASQYLQNEKGGR